LLALKEKPRKNLPATAYKEYITDIVFFITYKTNA
jgi:hypothetical protein